MGRDRRYAWLYLEVRLRRVARSAVAAETSVGDVTAAAVAADDVTVAVVVGTILDLRAAGKGPLSVTRAAAADAASGFVTVTYGTEYLIVHC